METFRLASYNVHGGIGLDGRFDPDRTSAVLHELRADVIALQEVTMGDGTDPGLLARLAGGVGLHATRGPVMKRGPYEYGNAVLSRYPVDSVTLVDLSVPGHEPRAAMDMELRVHGRPFRLINTHLGLSPFERRLQGLRLLALLGDAFHHPSALAGDLNGWFLARGPWVELRRRFGDQGLAPLTFPVFRPVVALDRIWVYPASVRGPATVHVSPTARVASDHLPVRVDIRLPVT